MEEPSMNSKTGTFTYSEIVEITSNFKTLIGKGGFGEVYFGTLKDGTDVAVKVLLSSSEQRRKAFRTEAKLLTGVPHKNLVSLEGCCDEDNEEALIYDYMPKGNLKQHLSGKSKTILMWNERLQIALDVASKASNISCTTGCITEKSDVYSFGIILLELVTCQPAIIRRGEEDEDDILIIEWIKSLIKNGDIQNIIDPRLQDEFNINVAWRVVEIAMSCVFPLRTQRLDMIRVLARLKECLDIEMS